MRDIRDCTFQNTRRLNILAYKSINSDDSFEVVDFCSDAADRLIGLYGWILVLSYILREKSLAIYFGDSQFSRNRTFNFIVSNIYVDKRSRAR